MPPPLGKYLQCFLPCVLMLVTMLAVPLTMHFYTGEVTKALCSVWVLCWITCNLVRSHGETMSPWILGSRHHVQFTCCRFFVFHFDSELTSYPRFYLTMSSSNDSISIPTLTSPNYLSWAPKMHTTFRQRISGSPFGMNALHLLLKMKTPKPLSVGMTEMTRL